MWGCQPYLFQVSRAPLTSPFHRHSRAFTWGARFSSRKVKRSCTSMLASEPTIPSQLSKAPLLPTEAALSANWTHSFTIAVSTNCINQEWVLGEQNHVFEKWFSKWQGIYKGPLERGNTFLESKKGTPRKVARKFTSYRSYLLNTRFWHDRLLNLGLSTQLLVVRT